MDNVAYIRFVNTHSECDGSHDNVNLLHDEGVLRLAACGCLHACMIGHGRYVISLEYLGQFLYLLAGETVDYSGLAGIGLDELYDVLIDVLGLGSYLVIEVGTVE